MGISPRWRLIMAFRTTGLDSTRDGIVGSWRRLR